MKKLFSGLFVFCLFSAAVNAQQLPQVTIVNNTGYTIVGVQFSSTADNTWGPDRLAANATIRNGRSVDLDLPHPLNVVNRYDIRLRDSEGDTYTKMNVQVSNNARVVFTLDDYDSSSSQAITIVNNTGYTIIDVQFSSTADNTWGPDRLAANATIRNRHSVTLNLPHPINVVNRYNIRLRDSEGDTYTKNNVTVSANARIVFTFDDIDD